MRPLFGESPPHASDGGTPQQSQAGNPQMTYFLGDESAIDSALQQSLSSFVTARDPRKQQQASPATGQADSGPSSPSKRSAARDREPSPSPSSSLHDNGNHPGDESGQTDLALQQTQSGLASKDTSGPITPLMLATSGPASAISGVSSPRNSVTASLSEEVGSAFSMSAEPEPELPSSMMDSGTAPQLVMPSIKMPSRRPFTDEGKRIGRLKVLVAGDSGIGKTALIKAIVQTSDAIVHVDPISPTPQFPVLGQRSSPRSNRRSKFSSKNSSVTNQISEIYASTKSYPEWWSDLDDFRLLKRKKSVGGDTGILDRNICFIDTPGYSDGSSSMDTIIPVIRYVESHFEKVQANTSADPDLLSMLGGDGGNQVDAVLYLVQNKLKPADVKYLQQLAPLTNVIPLLAQVDTLTVEAITQCKERIRSELVEAGVQPFSFTTAADARTVEPVWPYAISNLPGSDHDIMDASLLMSPDYVQPLVSSELGTLVELMFCEHGASWLRHSAAKKYLQWKNSDDPSRPRALQRPLSGPPGSPSSSVMATAPLTYSLARIADHTQREERLAQIRLANWASELSRSLANEKARYEAVARGERALWLTERLNECVKEGTLVPVRDPDCGASVLGGKMKRRHSRGSQATTTMQHQDPLGLLDVAARLKAKSWMALEILGGMSIVGGIGLWVSRNGWHSHALGWAIESWTAFWNGER